MAPPPTTKESLRSIRSSFRGRTTERGYVLISAITLAILYFALMELMLIDSSRAVREAQRFRARIVATTLAESAAELAALQLVTASGGPVNATDDQGTAQVTDDTAATFSSQGTPTGSTLKPEVVAPGRRIVSIRVPGSALDTLNPTRVVTAANGSTYLRMSGTSASAAVVSGSVALLLERQPSLSPNQVKAILTGTTQTYGAGLTHGLIDAFASVTSPSRGFANQGLHPADAFSRTLYPILYGQPLISSVDVGGPIDGCGT